MNKVVYIIPGFKEKTSNKSYQQIINFFKSRKFTTKPIDISWKYKTMTDYAKEFLRQVNLNKNEDIYLFGFSFGAMIAFISSFNIPTKMQILCSLSPYFREDLKYLPKSYKKWVGKNRIKDFKNFSINDLSKKIKSKTILIVGSKEVSDVYRRAKDAHKKIKNSELIISQDAKHNISQKEYLQTLKNIISRL